jgi:hypothetical protein
MKLVPSGSAAFLASSWHAVLQESLFLRGCELSWGKTEEV